jgi:hypothetical protein
VVEIETATLGVVLTFAPSADCCCAATAESVFICCFKTCAKRALMLRTSCKSLIFNEGKLRFRNWSRGRLSPLASIETAAGLTVWEVEATDFAGEGMAEVVGRARGVMAEGGGKLIPLDVEGRESGVL